MKQPGKNRALAAFSFFPNKIKLDGRIVDGSDTLPSPHFMSEATGPKGACSGPSFIMTEVPTVFDALESIAPD
jgi:hypothetical protein